MDRASAIATESRQDHLIEERLSVDPSYAEIKAQRDRLLREREALIEACVYLIGLHGGRRKLKLAIRTFLLRFKK